MPTYQKILRVNEQYALDNDKEPSAVKRLLLHYSGMNSTQLVANLQTTMPNKSYRSFLRAVDQHVIHNKPIQHLMEYEYFFGRSFYVNGDVLIPRSETEELAENVISFIDEYFADSRINVLDIGTGSGCLALTLALECDNVKAVATDISEQALSIARKNKERLGGDVKFKEGNLLVPVNGQTFDVVVSNPPYIPNTEKLDPVVGDHEPPIALFGGKNGLDYYKDIIRDLPNVLNDEFLVAFEHASHQGKHLKKMIKKTFKNVRIIQMKDMQGKDRMLFITNKKPENASS